MTEPEATPMDLTLRLSERLPLVPTQDELALDQAYQARAQRREDEEWARLLTETGQRESLAPMGQPTPEKPSAVVEGAKAGFEAAGQGAQTFMQGLTKFFLSGEAHPEDVGKGVATEVASGLAGKAVAVKEMVDGLMGVLSSPGAGAGAGVEQALKNAGLDAAMRIPGGQGGLAPLIRAASGGDVKDTAPMTLGEAANLVAQYATPALAARVKKGLPAGVKALGEERGSIGGRPPTHGFTEGPEDPRWLARFVRDRGGVAPSPTRDLAGEYERIPQRFKRGRGLSPSQMAEAVSEATGRPYSDAQLLADLEGVDRKSARVVAQQRGLEEGFAGFIDEPPRAAEALLGELPEPVPETVRINLKRIDAAESVKATIANINALNSERLATSRRTKSHAETVEGSRGAMTVEEALALPEGAPLTEEQVTALRDLRDAAATHVDHLVKRVLDGEADTGLIDAFLVAGEIEAKRETSVRTAARVLEAQKILSSAERAAFDMSRIAELAATLKDVTTDGIDEHVLANRLVALRTEGARRGYARSVGRYLWTGYKNVLDLLHWAWIQNLLSGPVTHAANVLGTGALTAYHIPERFVAGIINETFFRNPEGVRLGEAWDASRGMVEGAYTDSVRMMGRALQGETALGQGPIESHFDLRARTFGLDPNNLPGKAIEVAGMFQPTRLMGVEDAFFKGVNYRAELKALAGREARAEGLRGQALAERTGYLEANPTASMVTAAQDAALLRTLNASLGPAGQALMTALNLTPGARFVAPFVRTPTNIGKAVWQRAPVLNLLSAQNWKDISAGGARRDMAMARMALGSAVGAAIAWQVTQGNIAGEGPSNRNLKRDQREDGLPQCAVRVGEEWYQISRVDPVGMFVCTIATAVESLSQVPDPEEHWDAIAYAATTAAGKSMLSKTWATGVRDVLDAINKPDANAKKVAMGWARSIVPAGVRQVTRSGLPGVVEPHPEMREVRDYVDAILSGLPDLSPAFGQVGVPYDVPNVVDVPPQLHPITGEPMTYPAGWGPDLISPIYVTTRKNDPVLDEIVGNEVSIPQISRILVGSTPVEMRLKPESAREGIQLTKAEYLRLQWLATKGGEAGENGGVDLGAFTGQPTLYDRLLALITSDSYKLHMTPGPEGSRADEIKRIVNRYREIARVQLRRESEPLNQAILERQELRIRMKMPAEQQPPPTPTAGPKIRQFLESLGR